ncbi:jg14089 [Pararge aegeria aegeria]|uniref:Jg14089 protein n=1 Tax=Pararge aegeria aegeria TaxID=348720 RepID=A0A8S4RMP0_9NEOP|nr:jg14089 [Pararge aegeria aegeria]
MSKRGRTINSQSRALVVKLAEYFERESVNGGPLLPVTQVQDRVAEALGIGKKTIRNILKEKYGPSGTEENVLHTPKRRKKSKPVTGIETFDAHAIRNHVYAYYTRSEYPTRVSFLREMNKITSWDSVIFIDETWLNSNHTVPQSWTDDTKASCSKVPMGKGGRLIICHAGSAGGGFVNDALLAFESKSTKEYHEEMDANKFTDWFTNLLTNLPEQCIIIMDNASYHSVQIDKAPNQAHKKADLVAWLQRQGVEADVNMLKAELLRQVKENKPAKLKYRVDELALQHGHRVIRTPPYHCQYNAIEMIWAQVKGYAARHNTKPPFSTNKMMTFLKEACASVKKEDWVKVVEKTRKIIKEDYDRDVNIDNFIENEIIIFTGDDSSSSDFGSSSEENN